MPEKVSVANEEIIYSHRHICQKRCVSTFKKYLEKLRILKVNVSYIAKMQLVLKHQVIFIRDDFF